MGFGDVDGRLLSSFYGANALYATPCRSRKASRCRPEHCWNCNNATQSRRTGKFKFEIRDDAIGWSANQRAFARCRKRLDPCSWHPCTHESLPRGCVNNNTDRLSQVHGHCRRPYILVIIHQNMPGRPSTRPPRGSNTSTARKTSGGTTKSTRASSARQSANAVQIPD